MFCNQDQPTFQLHQEAETSIRIGDGWAQRRAQNRMGIDPEHWSTGVRQRVRWILLSLLSKDKVACAIIPAEHISFLFFFFLSAHAVWHVGS